MSETFPPREPEEIAAYELSEVVAGYTDWHASDPEPGPNHSPAYRWGWTNRKRDHGPEDDGFDALRQRYVSHIKLGRRTT